MLMEIRNLSPQDQVRLKLSIFGVSSLVFFLLIMIWHYFALIYLIIVYVAKIEYEITYCTKCGKGLDEGIFTIKLPEKCPCCGFPTDRVFEKKSID